MMPASLIPVERLTISPYRAVRAVLGQQDDRLRKVRVAQFPNGDEETTLGRLHPGGPLWWRREGVNGRELPKQRPDGANQRGGDGYAA